MYQEIKHAKTTPTVPVKPLPEEGYFELGNRRVTFFETPGHTPGSICLHDENTNYLFVGDCGANGGILLNLPMSLSAETALETAEKILAFVDEHGIDTIYPGHAPIGIRPDIFRKQAQGCRELMEGKASDKDLAKGEYYVDGYKISFSPDMIFKKDE